MRRTIVNEEYKNKSKKELYELISGHDITQRELKEIYEELYRRDRNR